MCSRCDRPLLCYEDEYHQRYCPCSRPETKQYACFECRRTFKMVIDTSRNDYYHDYPVLVRPNMKRIPDVWAKWNSVRWNWKHDIDKKPFKRSYNYARDLIDGKVKLTEEERQEMKAWCPEVWWQVLGSPRCPSCGQEGRPVGVTFEPPSARDRQAWRRLAEEDVAMPRDGTRCREARWEASMEKQRRIEAQKEQHFSKARHSRMCELQEAVKQGRRTDEEERKLVVIRAMRAQK